MKKFILFLMLICTLSLFAQESTEASPAEESQGFQMGGAAGSIVINGKTYTQLRLMPELVLGKFGIGLDVDLLVDSDGNVREEDWDEWQDYVNKVYYLRYGHRGDTFYGKIGGFNSYTLGHGLIMNGYSNMLKYPEVRQIGVQLGGKLPFNNSQVEIFTSNITENKILAGSFSFTPFSETSLPLVNKLNFNVQAVTDLDQYQGLTDEEIKSIPIDTDGDGIYDDMDFDDDGDGIWDYDAFSQGFTEEELQGLNLDEDVKRDKFTTEDDDIMIVSAGYDLPFVDTKLFTLGHYGEAAQIIDYGTGFIFPGFYSKFFIFDMNLEFRHFEDEFIPSYFDQLYDETRVSIYSDADTTFAYTKEQSLSLAKAASGWYGSLQANLFNVVFMKVAYQDMYGDNVETGKSIWGNVWLKENMIPKLTTANISYSQTNVDDVFADFKTPSAMIEGKIGYSLSESTILVYKYQERYADYNNNGKIDSNNDEVIKTMGMGVEFKF